MKAQEVVVRTTVYGVWGIAIVGSLVAWGVRRLLGIEVP